MNILITHYNHQIRKDLIMQHNYNKVDSIPKLTKIVINIGAKEALTNKKKLVPSILAMDLITGSLPKVTKSKKAIANFNLKKNYPIGIKVSLHKSLMYNFLFKLINSAIYLNKEFSGLTMNKFNNQSYINTSISDISAFLEISTYYENFEYFQGLDIAIITTPVKLTEAKSLLTGFRLPIFD